MEKVLVLKLVTGEDILAEIDEDETHVIITNPVRIAVVPGQNGQPNVGFAPWPVHAEQETDAEYLIQKKHVVYHYKPAQEYLNNYNQIFGSGIVVPPTKQIITG
ncbi:MAG: hypothetical protein EBU90_17735 [Proteobacteria bacterium]|nr:hypothetical protein [Pseudomonadota bacterium]